MSKYDVTVLMCEYNTKKEELKEAINSLLNQTYKDFKILIIDDCTCKENQEVLKQFNDPRIEVIRNEENLKLEKSLNKGLSLIDTKYIVRMDTDDIAHKERIQKQVEFAGKNQQYSIISTRVNVFNEKGIYKVTDKYGEIRKEDLLFGTPFVHPSMLLRTEDIKAIGGYPLFNRAEDYAMTMNMYANGYKGYVMEDILLDYRMTDDGYKKKKYRHRITEAKIRFIYFRKMKVKFYQYIYIIKPLIVGLIPKNLLKRYHTKTNN